jgi:hypothetical protein
MRYLWITTYTFLIVGLSACQPAESTPLIPEGMEGTRTAAQALTPISTSEDTHMVSPVPPNTHEQKIVTLAKEHLAQKLAIAVDQIAILEVKSVVWRDASLGCPKPSVDYIPVETPGYSIVLEAGGQTYHYHSDEVKRFVICNRP